MIRVNGMDIPEPATYEVLLSDLDADGSGRTADGTMVRDRVAMKYKLTMTWNALKPNEMAKLLQFVKDQFFSCEFLDPYTGTYIVRTMYVGDRTAPIAYSRNNGSFIWRSLSMDFIEQ